MTTLDCLADDAEATRAIGERLGRELLPATVVLLQGPLGAGKTTLAQGIAAGMGVTERVQSPTFVLVREYATARGLRLVHMDFYRLSGPIEALELGLEDYLSRDDVVLVEWPENAAGALPASAVLVELRHEGDGRRIRLSAHGRLATCVECLANTPGCG